MIKKLPIFRVFARRLSSRPWSKSKVSIADNRAFGPSSKYKQELKYTVANELANHTWQFDAATVAKMLSPKKRKTPFDPRYLDTLEDYEDNTIDVEVLKKAVDSLKSTAKLPKSEFESKLYSPLCLFLNNCVQACQQALNTNKSEGYYKDLKFILWGRPMADGVAGAKPLKPDFGGVDLEGLPETGFHLSWGSDYRLSLPGEVKKDWPELVCQAGMYARCLFNANPLRQFALVLGYNHVKQELRFLIFHRGGLTSSLPLNPNSDAGRQDILRIFFAILSWKTPADAGFPMWCNNSEMELPLSTTSGDESTRVQVKKVLHRTLCIRGRAAQVSLVSMLNASQTIGAFLALFFHISLLKSFRIQYQGHNLERNLKVANPRPLVRLRFSEFVLMQRCLLFQILI